MKRYLGFLSLVFVLGVVSSSFAADPLLIGNFEDGESSGGRYDLWYGDGLVLDDVTVPTATVTRGSHSLKCTSDTGGWGPAIPYPINERGDKFDVYALAANEGAVIGFDVTFETVPGGWVEIGYFTNNGAPVGPGWDKAGWVAVPAEYLDGLPHRWAIPLEPLQASLQSVVDQQDDGGYYNLGIAFNTGAGPFVVYVDNIWIYPEGLIDQYGPYNPVVEQEFNVNPLFVDLMLHWKAGADPNDEVEVNPLITDQYVFMDKGIESDPNLYYIGSTGEDPGLTDPNSQFGPLLLPINSTYSWAVVEALEGNEQVFTVGVSNLNDADPNNIIGPIWHFYTLSTLPSITTQPASIRIPLGATVDPAFSVAVQSATPPSYQWYSSVDAVRDPVDEGGTDVAIGAGSNGNTAAMKISNASAGYQRYFYCKVWNAATFSGGGAFDDVYSNVVTCVVERKVAEYKFENTLTDTGSNIASDLNHGTARNGAGFSTDRVEGSYSLSLDGSAQYVELGSSTDPNTFNKCYPRAALVAEDGIGGGLDIGTILCWVKLDATAANEVSPIMYNTNAGWPTTVFQFDIPTDSAAANTNLRTAIWGDDEVLTMVDVNPAWADPFSMAGDGQWHLLASAWDRNAGTMKAYLDGSLLATWGAEPSVFSAWDNTMTIGFDGTNYFGGLIDNLRVYNYEVAAEVIAQEYYDVTGDPGCIYLDFTGSSLNADNTGTSYCRIDIADLAAFAGAWLADGFYP